MVVNSDILEYQDAPKNEVFVCVNKPRLYLELKRFFTLCQPYFLKKE